MLRIVSTIFHRSIYTLYVSVIFTLATLGTLPVNAQDDDDLLNLLLLIKNFRDPVSAESILIRNVTVIDGTGANARSGMDVAINGERITGIMSANINPASDGTIVIDGTGMYLIPGLWDMHVHWNLEAYLPLFIANGVTGVREMWGWDWHYDWKQREADMDFVAPRYMIASAIIDGVPKIWADSIEVANAAEAREQVRIYKNRGANFIKVYSNLSRDAYFAIVDESKQLGIPFAGHVPNEIGLDEASDAGQLSFEHMLKFPLDTSSAVDQVAIFEQSRITGEAPENYLELQEQVYAAYDEEQSEQLYEKFIMNNTWMSPTLTVIRNLAYLRERLEIDQDRLTYLPASETQAWITTVNDRSRDYSEDLWTFTQRRYRHIQKILGHMNRAGVKIIAGTDVLNPFCFPGFSLHDELVLLVESGLTPMQAIQAATRNAAEFAGRLDELGTVEEGKLADLVLLTANPLDDISNTTKISAVIFKGHFYDGDSIDFMLRQVQEIANFGR